MSPSASVCGRLAPSPTGYIHLGNVWAFLLAWLAARSAGGRVILRLEDIDPQRSRPVYADAMLEDLRWLGLDWDEGPDVGGPAGSYRQSQRGALYAAAVQRLEAAGLVYPCFCTRRELRQLAGAPHLDDAGAPYPGTCRDLSAEECAAHRASGRKASLRLRCPSEPLCFIDLALGPQEASLVHCGGDFALRRSDGVWAYQLAVAVDDALMGVTQVVRGRDILPSTPRQLAILALLGYAAPQYGHVPLLLDGDGERLAKRHQSLAIRELRQQGADARRIVGFLGWRAGLLPVRQAASPAELLPRFAWERLPKDDQLCRREDVATFFA